MTTAVAQKPNRGSSRTTRDRLLTAAEALFAEKGFEGTSLRDIGRVMGMANASLLHHFPTKGRLYAAVLMRIADSLADLVDGLALARARPVDERTLAAIHRGFFNWCRAHPAYARLLVRELLDNPARVDRVERWFMAELVERMAAVIEAGQKAGTFRPCDPTLFLIHMIGSISYIFVALPTLAGMTGRDREALFDRYGRESLDHLRRAILSPAGGAAHAS